LNITLEITPAVQAELARQASLNGRDLEIHAASLLEEALHLSLSDETSANKTNPNFGKRLVEVFADARRMGLFADGELDFGRDPSPGRLVDLS